MFIGSGDGLKTCGFAAAPGGVAVSGRAVLLQSRVSRHSYREVRLELPL